MTSPPFRAFGVVTRSEIHPPFAHYTSGEPRLHVHITQREDRTTEMPPVLALNRLQPEGQGWFQVWREGHVARVRVAPVAEFLCSADRIECHPFQGATAEGLQWQLFGLMLALSSEQRGAAVLHGAAVEIGGRVAGLVGQSGVGKSSLSMEFKAANHRVFGDDHVVIETTATGAHVHPSLPWLKVSPDVLAMHHIDASRLPVVHSAMTKRRVDLTDAQWGAGAAALGAIYVLDRRADVTEIAFERISGARSLLELVKHSYVPRTVEAIGLTPDRLRFLAATAKVGVWGLAYPSGFEWLPSVREELCKHMASARF